MSSNCQDDDAMVLFQKWWIWCPKSSCRMQDGCTRIYCGGFWKGMHCHTASNLAFQEAMPLPTSFSAGGQQKPNVTQLCGLATTSDLLRLMKVTTFIIISGLTLCNFFSSTKKHSPKLFLDSFNFESLFRVLGIVSKHASPPTTSIVAMILNCWTSCLLWWFFRSFQVRVDVHQWRQRSWETGKCWKHSNYQHLLPCCAVAFICAS